MKSLYIKHRYDRERPIAAQISETFDPKHKYDNDRRSVNVDTVVKQAHTRGVIKLVNIIIKCKTKNTASSEEIQSKYHRSRQDVYPTHIHLLSHLDVGNSKILCRC